MELTKLHQKLGALVLMVWELEEQNVALRESFDAAQDERIKRCEGCDGRCGEEREAEPE